MNTLFSSKQICEIKQQNQSNIMSWPMKNKHVFLYFFDNCFSSLNPASVSEFPLWFFFLVTLSVGDSSLHSHWKNKCGLMLYITYFSLFSRCFHSIKWNIMEWASIPLNILSFCSIKNLFLPFQGTPDYCFLKVLYSLCIFWHDLLKRFWIFLLGS